MTEAKRRRRVTLFWFLQIACVFCVRATPIRFSRRPTVCKECIRHYHLFSA